MHKLFVLAILSLSCTAILPSQSQESVMDKVAYPSTPVTDFVMKRLSLNSNFNAIEADIANGQPSSAASYNHKTTDHYAIIYHKKIVPGVEVIATISEEKNLVDYSLSEEDPFSICFKVSIPSKGFNEELSSRMEYLCRSHIPVEVFLKKFEEFRKQHASTQLES